MTRTTRSGFTLLEVMLAAIILGLSLTGLLVSMSQCERMMLSSCELETVQEVMDLGDMAYPLSDVTDPQDLDVQEEKAVDLFEMIAEQGTRLSDEQEDKYKGYTWERECLNRNDTKDVERLGGLYVVKVTVKWNDDHRGNHDEESYITLWREPSS